MRGRSTGSYRRSSNRSRPTPPRRRPSAYGRRASRTRSRDAASRCLGSPTGVERSRRSYDPSATSASTSASRRLKPSRDRASSDGLAARSVISNAPGRPPSESMRRRLPSIDATSGPAHPAASQFATGSGRRCGSGGGPKYRRKLCSASIEAQRRFPSSPSTTRLGSLLAVASSSAPSADRRRERS